MKDKYLTVTALTRYVKRKIDTDPHLGHVFLRGEISNFKHHSRGHMYMTIKDQGAKILGVMFAGDNRSLKFQPENGMQVLIEGNVSVFEAAGQYQVYIRKMEPDGIGSLYIAYEQLKNKLEMEGLFHDSIKKAIPLFPEQVAVITSPTGAAVRDIISTIERRYPFVKVNLLPVSVQGENGAASIVNAIQKANDLKMGDTIILGRGGGSIEELWNFNEERVARAIHHSEIPVISAVGHETDYTISDFVADLRAATPTAAAELAVPSATQLKERLSSTRERLHKQMQFLLDEQQNRYTFYRDSYAFRYPKQLIRQKEQELDGEMESLHRSFRQNLDRHQTEFRTIYNRLQMKHPAAARDQAVSHHERLHKNLENGMKRILENKATQFTNTIDKLTLVNPLGILKRGFALPYDENQKIIQSRNDVEKNDEITIQLSDGMLDCRVENIREEHSNE